MKKLLLYSASIIIFAATSCSKTNVGADNGFEGEIREYGIVASIADEKSSDPDVKGLEASGWEVSSLSAYEKTRNTVSTESGVTKWLVNSTAHFLAGSASEVSLFNVTGVSSDGKTATFTGNSALLNAQQKLYGVTPATGVYQNNIYTLAPITFQDNTIDHTAMVAYPMMVDFSDNVISEKISFSHLYSAMGIQFKLPDNISGKVTSVVIKKITNAGVARRLATTLGRRVNIKAEPGEADFRELTSQNNEAAAEITIIMPNGGEEVAPGGKFEMYAKIHPCTLPTKKIFFIVNLEDGSQLTGEKLGTNFVRGGYHRFKEGDEPVQLKAATNIVFSDEKFKTFLLNATIPNVVFHGSETKIDGNNDNEISIEEAAKVVGISSPNEQLTSLGGVEYFSNLTKLDCSRNALTYIDISKLTQLLDFNCTGNSSSSFVLLHTTTQKGHIDNSTTRPNGWNWLLNSPIRYIDIVVPTVPTGQVPLVKRVNVQTEIAASGYVIDNEWVGVGINRDYAIQHDYSLPFRGKPSYRFELKENDNSLEGYVDDDSKGRSELSYCYATAEDFIGYPDDAYAKAQIVKTVYHYGKGACAQGSSMKYQFSFYAPSTLDPTMHSIFAQWHGMPTRTLAQKPDGTVVQLTEDEFIELSKTVVFKKDTGYDIIGGEVAKEPNGWMIEQGGYPPLAFGLANGVFYIKANSDKKWLTDKTDRTNANSLTTPVMRPRKSEFKESTIAYRMTFEEFPKDKWITFDVEIDWTQYGGVAETITKAGRLDVKMTHDVDGASVMSHIVNNEEIMIGRNDKDGYYFKFGIYRTSGSLIPVQYNLAGYSETLMAN